MARAEQQEKGAVYDAGGSFVDPYKAGSGAEYPDPAGHPAL